MLVSDTLFKLIKSLNKQEKINFKSFCQGNHKKHVQLFDAIASQNRYDEEKIKRQFKDEVFVKQLSVTKNYLYKIIILSLCNYDTDEVLLPQMIHEIKLLYNKALYSLCEKVIHKAKKIAEETEQFIVLYELLDWERKVLYNYATNPTARKKLQAIVPAQLSALDKQQNMVLFRKLYNDCFIVGTQSLSVRDKAQVKLLNKLMRHPLLSHPGKALTFLSKINFHLIHALYHKLTGNDHQAYEQHKNQGALFELKENHIYLKTYKQAYCSTLCALNGYEAMFGKEEEFNSTFQKLTAFLEKNPELKKLYSLTMYANRSFLMYRIGNYHEIPLFMADFETDFAVFKGDIRKEHLLVLYINFSCLYVGNQDYKNALHWLNKILQDASSKEFREDIYCGAYILNLIIHYELGNEELLEPLTRSTYRYLLKRKNLYNFENTILTFIRTELIKVKTHSELILAFQRLHRQLVQLSKDPFERRFLDGFDYISWLESKIENKNFSEIIKSKNQISIATPSVNYTS